MTSSRRAMSVIFAGAILVLAGCAAPPPPGSPITDAERSELAALLSGDSLEFEALRGSGDGVATVDGRRVSFAFAIVFDRPAWVRADLRPRMGSLSSTMTALVLWDRSCGRCYLPGRMVEVRGCLPGHDGLLRDLDGASLLVGAPGPSLIDNMRAAIVRRRKGSLVVEGNHAATSVSLELSGEPPRLRTLSFESEDGRLTFSYEGHGWKTFEWLPEVTEITLERGSRRVFSAELTFKAARLTGHVERESFHFDVPPEVTIVGWEDLELWRSE